MQAESLASRDPNLGGVAWEGCKRLRGQGNSKVDRHGEEFMEAMFTPQSFRQLRLRDTTALSASREAPATCVSALISDSGRCRCNMYVWRTSERAHETEQ